MGCPCSVLMSVRGLRRREREDGHLGNEQLKGREVVLLGGRVEEGEEGCSRSVCGLWQ